MISPSDLPPHELASVAVAVLLELTLYFTQQRKMWPRGWLLLSAILPQILITLPAGNFDLRATLALAVLAALPLFWFRLLPPSRATDLGFVLLMAAPIIFKFFVPLYPRPHPEWKLEFLGQLMWIRVGITAVLEDRRPSGIGFGFWPTAREWRTGLQWALIGAPVAMLLSVLSGFATFRPPDYAWWQIAGIAIGTFAGIFLVVALSEEFFFRGLLQTWVSDWTGSFPVGLLVASLLFGAAHLGFRQFPNWTFAALAAVAGVFYGMAFRRGGGIRAAMVTHAIVVTLWRTLFR